MAYRVQREFIMKLTHLMGFRMPIIRDSIGG